MIYFNNAATSYPKPEVVLQAVQQTICSFPSHAGRAGVEQYDRDPVRSCREALTRLLGAEHSSDIILTPGATYALNLVMLGSLGPGDHVVTTAIEHNSVYRPLNHLKLERGIDITIVPCDQLGFVSPEAIGDALTPTTRMVVVNHCSNVTGAIQDIEAIGHLVKDHPACLVVDASQSAGSIPIHIRDIPVDALVFAGHKNLFGYQGTGGLYLADTFQPAPLITGGTGTRSDYQLQPIERPARYEAGTLNGPGFSSLGAGVTFCRQNSPSSIQQHKTQLIKPLLEFLLDEPRVTLYRSRLTEDSDHFDAIVSFNIKGIPAEECGFILEHSFGIICRTGLHCAPLIHSYLGSSSGGTVRISCSFLNHASEIQTLIDALKQMIHAL